MSVALYLEPAILSGLHLKSITGHSLVCRGATGFQVSSAHLQKSKKAATLMICMDFEF
jgi:hypothetical protein